MRAGEAWTIRVSCTTPQHIPTVVFRAGFKLAASQPAAAVTELTLGVVPAGVSQIAGGTTRTIRLCRG